MGDSYRDWSEEPDRFSHIHLKSENYPNISIRQPAAAQRAAQQETKRIVITKVSVGWSCWETPDMAIAQDGFPLMIGVSALDDETLDGLALAWLEELYEKAGRSNPFTRRKS